ncbi:hypothetical protein M8J77_006940 [Diaphorina citri]|nr:hypothetical protein M8J77_006940 [Diaphorina citri]
MSDQCSTPCLKLSIERTATGNLPVKLLLSKLGCTQPFYLFLSRQQTLKLGVISVYVSDNPEISVRGFLRTLNTSVDKPEFHPSQDINWTMCHFVVFEIT